MKFLTSPALVFGTINYILIIVFIATVVLIEPLVMIPITPAIIAFFYLNTKTLLEYKRQSASKG